jgi:hypothetical protein
MTERLSRLACYPKAESEPSFTGYAVYRWTGEHRPPRKGEWYLSGAIIEAYRAERNLAQSYAIAKPITE